MNYSEIGQLIDFINTAGINLDKNIEKRCYYHMGATITDSILQAGLNYRNVVLPRVMHLRDTYKEFKTTCEFIILFQSIDLETLINFNNKIKINRIKNLSWFFYNNQIENENQLSYWIRNPGNERALLEISGIGLKTVDYLKILSGNDALAIDRHLLKFIELAGLGKKTYNEASILLSFTAESLQIDKSFLDKKIWLYMSKS